MQDCECALQEKTGTLGAAAALCHHSPLDEVRSVRQDLNKVLSQFTYSPDTQDLFNALTPFAEKFGRDVTGDDYELLNPQEHNTLMVAFFRQLSLSAQLMLATLLINRERP